MTLHLPSNIEDQLRRLAHEQGREVDAVVEEAVRQYLAAAAITDVTPDQLAQTQAKMMGELGIAPWTDSPENGSHAKG